jgi:hypothetical protein
VLNVKTQFTKMVALSEELQQMIVFLSEEVQQ